MCTVGLLGVVGNFAVFSHSYCERIVEVFFVCFAFWVVVYIVVGFGRGLCLWGSYYCEVVSVVCLCGLCLCLFVFWFGVGVWFSHFVANTVLI